MNWRLALRRLTTATLRLMPASAVRYALKSYYYNQDLQNRVKYHIQPFRFDCPIPDVSEIDVSQLDVRRNLPFIPRDLRPFFPLLDKFAPFARELASCPRKSDGKSLYWFRNFGYEDFDAISLYSMIRLLKPARMIEVGCGYSSRVTTTAALKNRSEGANCEFLFVEPFPPPYLLDFTLPGPLRVEKIQATPISEFEKLRAGDILFIDTTHIMKTQSDLVRIFNEILPAVAGGVYIHIHDIFTPYEYPKDWLLKSGLYFNEQYELEAVLSNSDRFEVVLPLYALWREHFDRLSQLLPGTEVAPGAFWMRKK